MTTTRTAEHRANVSIRNFLAVARKYGHHSLSMMDLINEGNIGLMRAAEKFDPTVGGEGDLSLADVCADTRQDTPDSRVHDEDLRRCINESIAGLSNRERKVLQARFGLDGRSLVTLEHLSKQIGLSKERVRQIEKNAILKLRASRSARKLVAYLN